MENGTAMLMIKALDGLSTRATVTAENIANASTPNYRPLRVSFEKALETAAIEGGDVGAVEPQIARAANGTPESELRLDLELATASTTALRYSALIETLNRQMQIESLAITGNS